MFRSSSNCAFENQGFKVNWFVDQLDNVIFNITFSNFIPGDWWTGIGFGPNMASTTLERMISRPLVST
jgi:hypothetical protein